MVGKRPLKKSDIYVRTDEKETALGSSGERAGRGSRNSKCKGPEVGMNVKERKMAVWLEYSEQGGEWHKLKSERQKPDHTEHCSPRGEVGMSLRV